MTPAGVLFYIFAALALGSAVLVITGKNAITCAIYLVVSFFNLAALYVLLDAHFLAATQILVYAGAITVLILFVIMLLDIAHLGVTRTTRNAAAKSIGIVMVGLLAALLLPKLFADQTGFRQELPQGFGSPEAIGDLLFKTYLLPFEIVSVLLLAAVVAAVAIAHKHEESAAASGEGK